MEPQDTIFLKARDLADAAQRAAYLTQACGLDADLRQRVEAMVRDATGADEFFGPEGTTLSGASVTEGPGTVIGRFKLLQKIGEGGMGVVYMAEQREPVSRKVALKIIKLGMDTHQVIARFEAERQALALMDHPNIAKVLDGGVTGSGRPYFVMELVAGLPITQFCDESNLSTDDRLKLFLEVCSAIQHAHQKGIIHRDIKPTNILVTLHGDRPVPNVIDFGVAKATQGRLTEKTLFTQFQQFIGTPAYMSPEQASLSGLDVDTRSDIYALGVLLYELLTGRTPLDAKELLKAGLDEMRRTIQEKQPLRPSDRISTLQGEDLTTAAKQRRTDPPKLIHLVRGDLDWIVMKALEKDRARRYETANGLARDIQRHLSCEPVVARPPSRLYEFQKTVRRHKLGFAAAAAIITVLAAGAVVSTLEAIRAKRAEHLAKANFQKARKTVDEYFTTISETTLLEAPGLQPLRKQLLEAALSYYQGFLEQARDNPELVADLAAAHLRLSVVYIALDRNDDAVPAMLRGLELVEQVIQKRPDDTDLPRRLAGFFKISGDIYSQTRPPSDPIKAANTLQKAAEIWEKFARDNPATVEFQGDLAGIYMLLSALFQSGDDFDRCLAYVLRSRAILEELVRARPTAAAYQDLLVLNYAQSRDPLFRIGRTQESEQVLRQAVRYFENLAQEFPAELSVRRSLARVYIQLADALENTQPSAAESIYRQALGLLENLVAESPANAHYRQELYEDYNHLAGLLSKAGRNEDVEALAGKALLINEQLVLEFPGMAEYRLDLGKRYLVLAERLKGSHPLEAEQAYRRALAVHEKLAADFPGQGRFMAELANNHQQLISLLRSTGKSQEIEKLYRQDIARYEKWVTVSPNIPENWQELARSHNALGIFLRNDGRRQEAEVELHKTESVIREELAARRKLPGNEHPDVAAMLLDLAVLLGDQGKLAEAEKTLREAIISFKRLVQEDPRNRDYRVNLGHSDWRLADALRGAGQREQAEQVLREAVQVFEQAARDFPAHLYIRQEQAFSRRSLADVLNELGQVDEAERQLRAAIALYAALKATAANPWYRQEEAYTTWTLATMLEGAGRLDVAEAEYRQAIALHEKASAAFTNQAVLTERLGTLNVRLVELLRRRGRLAEAATAAREAEQKCHTAMAQYEKLASDSNHHRECWSFAISYEAIGAHLKEIGQTQAAEKAYRDTQVLWRKLVAGFNAEDYRFCLAVNYDALGNILRETGRATESLKVYQDAQAIWLTLVADFNLEDHRMHLGYTDDDIGHLLKQAGRFEETIEAYRQALAVWKKLVAEFNKDAYRNRLTGTLVSLATTLQTAGKLGEVETLYREALAAYTKLGAVGSQEYAAAVRSLREVLKAENKPAAVETLYREVLAAQRSALGEDSSTVAATLFDLANFLKSQNRPQEAAQTYRESLDIILKPPVKEHLFKLSSAVVPALVEAGEKQQATNICRAVLNSTATNAFWFNNVSWYLATAENPSNRDPALAVELAKRAVEINPAGDWNTVGVAHYRAGDFKQAVSDLEKSVQNEHGEGTSFDFFFQAMAEHQVGNGQDARRYYAKAIQWMKEHDSQNAELLRFRAEAERLLGAEVKARESTEALEPGRGTNAPAAQR